MRFEFDGSVGEHQRTRDLGTHIRPARFRSSVARRRRPTALAMSNSRFRDGVDLYPAGGELRNRAVGDAMAMVFWAEPTVTFDLDIFALLPESETGSPIISLEALYAVLRKRGFEVAAEHVMIHGTPVQFLVSPNQLSDEAIQTAVAQELDGVPFRVMRPEHLCALWLQAGGAKRRERVEVLRQSGAVDDKALQTLLRKHGISG